MKSEFYRQLKSLVLPITFQQFMLAAVSAADAIMLGALSQEALGAVSLATQVQFVFNLFLAAITIGLSMFAAQYWGKGDRVSVEKFLGIALRPTLLVSLLFFGASLFAPALLMRIFTPEATLISQGAEYLRWVSLSYLLCGASQVYLCIMKNCGQAGRSTLISSTAVVLNIILNALLIFGLCGLPALGIAGAALATVVARLVELVWTVYGMLQKERVKIRLDSILRPVREFRRDFWKYTSPVLGNELVWGCGFSMYTVILGHLGTDAVAANAVANVVKNLIVCFCLGLCVGGGIMVGYELGQNNLEKARTYGAWLTRISVIWGVVSGLFLLAITPLVLKYSNLNAQANGYLRWMMVFCTIYMVGKSINCMTIAGIFCAGGDSRFGFFCDLITIWCITIPLGLLGAFVLDLPVVVVYLIVNSDELLKLPAVWWRYHKFHWLKNLTIQEAK